MATAAMWSGAARFGVSGIRGTNQSGKAGRICRCHAEDKTKGLTYKVCCVCRLDVSTVCLLMRSIAEEYIFL